MVRTSLVFVLGLISFVSSFNSFFYSPGKSVDDNTAGALIGTISELRANKSLIYTTAFTTDHGGGQWYYFQNGFGYNDNTGTVLKDERGGAWVRLYDNVNLQVDWWIPNTDLTDTSDETTYIQQALDNAAGKTISFTAGRKYIIQGVWLSDNSTIDFNGAIIEAHPGISQANAVLFRYQPNMIGYDGRYAGNIISTSKQNPKLLKGVTLKNGIFYGKNYNVVCIQYDCYAANYTTVENLVIDNCVANNFSSRSYTVSNTPYITDSAAVIKNAAIINSKSYYNGQNIALYVTKPAVPGDTSLYIKTIDQTSINNRIGVGKYIQFGSKGPNSVIINTGYGGTNKLYRIKRFVLNTSSNNEARIDISGGGYDPNNGFVDSAMGLTANVIANTVVLPVENWAFPKLLSMPSFSGKAGQNTADRSATSSQQDAAFKNIWVGQEISFAGQPGNYIITGLDNSSITFSPALVSTFANQRLILNGLYSDAVYINGYIQNIKVDNCKFYGGMHAVAIAGSGGKGLYQENAMTSQKFTNNEFWYQWMSVEMTSGTDGRFTINKKGLDNRSVKAGDTLLLIGSPELYRTGSKDIDNDGIADVFLTNAGTADKDVTQMNSLFAGEIVGTPSLHYRYKVTGILQKGSDIYLSMQRWNQYLKNTVSGGFEADVPNMREFRRIYTLSTGETGQVNYQEWSNNKFYYLWRTGSAGYNLSIRGFNILVQGNEFYNCGTSPLEISGYSLRFLNNKLISETFTGDKIIPGTYTARNGLSGIGAGGWGTFFSHRLDIENNTATFTQPVSVVNTDYSFFTGRFNLAPQQHTLYSAELLNFSGNNVSGVRHTLYTTNESESVSGAWSAPYYYYDTVKISNNIFSLPQDYMNNGFFSQLYSPNTEIENNTFSKQGGLTGSFKIFGKNAVLNPNIFDSTKTNYNIIVGDNKYGGATPALNTELNKSKIKWNN